MVDLNDIHSLSDFQRDARRHINRLKRTGRPEVLTVNGKAAVVVQDAASYQKLLDLIDRTQAIDGIRRGLADVESGRTRPAAEVFEDLNKQVRGRTKS